MNGCELHKVWFVLGLDYCLLWGPPPVCLVDIEYNFPWVKRLEREVVRVVQACILSGSVNPCFLNVLVACLKTWEQFCI